MPGTGVRPAGCSPAMVRPGASASRFADETRPPRARILRLHRADRSPVARSRYRHPAQAVPAPAGDAGGAGGVGRPAGLGSTSTRSTKLERSTGRRREAVVQPQAGAEIAKGSRSAIRRNRLGAVEDGAGTAVRRSPSTGVGLRAFSIWVPTMKRAPWCSSSSGSPTTPGAQNPPARADDEQGRPQAGAQTERGDSTRSRSERPFTVLAEGRHEVQKPPPWSPINPYLIALRFDEQNAMLPTSWRRAGGRRFEAQEAVGIPVVRTSSPGA